MSMWHVTLTFSQTIVITCRWSSTPIGWELTLTFFYAQLRLVGAADGYHDGIRGEGDRPQLKSRPSERRRRGEIGGKQRSR